MALTSRQVSVTTGAAIELTDGTGPTLRQDYAIAVINTDATNPIYLGATGVTSATGYKLPAGGQVSIDLEFGDRLYARATGGTVVAGILQTKF